MYLNKILIFILIVFLHTGNIYAFQSTTLRLPLQGWVEDALRILPHRKPIAPNLTPKVLRGPRIDTNRVLSSSLVTIFPDGTIVTEDGRIPSLGIIVNIWNQKYKLIRTLTLAPAGSCSAGIIDIKIKPLPNGNIVTTISGTYYDPATKIWDKEGKSIKEFPNRLDLSNILPNGNIILTLLPDYELHIYGQDGRKIKDLYKCYIALTLPNGSMVIKYLDDNKAIVIDQNGNTISTLKIPEGVIYFIAIEGNVYTLKEESDGTVKIRDQDSNLIKILEQKGIKIGEKQIKVLSGGNILTRDSDNGIRIWNVKSGLAGTVTVTTVDNNSDIQNLPDGNPVIRNRFGVVSIYEQNGKCAATLDNGVTKFQSFKTLKNGTIITKDHKGEVSIWDRKGKEIGILGTEDINIILAEGLPNGDVITYDCKAWRIPGSGEIDNTLAAVRYDL